MKRLITFLFLLCALGSVAQVPGTLSYQGILMQNDGVTPVADGTHTVVFSFYDASEGGNLLCTRTAFPSTVNGLFTCIIGSGSPGSPNEPLIPGDISNGQAYIGIAVDGGSELAPRTQLTPTVYAMRAKTVEYYEIPEHGNGPVPAGSIIMWSGSPTAIPEGYVLCSGGTYEDKDGTARPVPDLRGRFVVGFDPETSETPANVTSGKQINYALVGNTGGENMHTLITGEMPAHNHSATSGDAGDHTHDGTTSNNGNHSHNTSLDYGTGIGGTHALAAVEKQNSTNKGSNSTGAHTHTFTTGSSGIHNHTVTVGSTGGGGSHENRPPYFVLAYIMKKY